MNVSILFWLNKFFVSLPDKFTPLRRLKVSARCASFPSQISSETNKAKSILCACKKSNISFCNSNRRSITFLRERHQNAVYSKRFEYSDPNSWQSCENNRDLSNIEATTSVEMATNLLYDNFD